MAENIFGGSRWAELATAALKDLALTLQSPNAAPSTHTEPTPCALWLVLPDASTPGVPRDVVTAINAAVNTPELRSRWQVQHGTLIRGGHTAGLLALEQAQAFLQSKTAIEPKLAVVLAVDCPLTPERLDLLQQQNLLQGAHQRVRGESRGNPYGRIPGEGAAAVALSEIPIDAIAKLTRNSTDQQKSTPKTWSARYLEDAKRTSAVSAEPLYRPWSQLLGVGTAQEEITWAVTQAQSKPCLGLGLTQAVFNALDQAAQNSHHLIADNKPPQITTITTDMNGEPYRGDELGFTLLRLAQQSSRPLSPAMPKLHEAWQRRTPVLASGDMGSASAIAHTALAAFDLHRQGIAATSHPATCHLVLSSSDDPLRGAVVLGALPTQSFI
jgi:3-oxoacyl-[acyl-carrier-protein] synthase-1